MFAMNRRGESYGLSAPNAVRQLRVDEGNVDDRVFKNRCFNFALYVPDQFHDETPQKRFVPSVFPIGQVVNLRWNASTVGFILRFEHCFPLRISSHAWSFHSRCYSLLGSGEPFGIYVVPVQTQNIVPPILNAIAEFQYILRLLAVTPVCKCVAALRTSAGINPPEIENFRGMTLRILYPPDEGLPR